MGKKITVLVVAVAALFTMSMATTAFAAGPPFSNNTPPFGAGAGGYGIYSLITDENGDFVSRDMFEANLDEAVADGTISAEDKESFLEMYDYRLANGGSEFGPISKEVFEENLDKAIADGRISAEDKEFFLKMYEYRSANGGPAFGCGRGGFGRGFMFSNN